MIKIKELTQDFEDIHKNLFDFFIRSKPYEFCSSSSISSRKIKINNFLNEIINDCIIFGAFDQNNKWIGYVFLEKEPEYMNLVFVFGDNINFKSNFLIKSFHEILIKVQEKFDKKPIKSIILRKQKVDKYLNWIKRYDKKCIIIEDLKHKEKTQIIWEYERLNQDNWHK